MIDQTELLAWLKPEPASGYELDCAAAVDPVSYAVYSEKLNLILAEAMDIFTRSGISDTTLAGDVGRLLLLQ